MLLTPPKRLRRRQARPLQETQRNGKRRKKCLAKVLGQKSSTCVHQALPRSQSSSSLLFEVSHRGIAAKVAFNNGHIGKLPTELVLHFDLAHLVFLLGDHLFFFCPLQQVDWDFDFRKFCFGQLCTVCVATDIHIPEEAWVIELFGKDAIRQNPVDILVLFIRRGLANMNELWQGNLLVDFELPGVWCFSTLVFPKLFTLKRF